MNETLVKSSSTTLSDEVRGAFRHVTLANGVVRAEVLPELGGKITSLVRLASGHEFLLQPQRELRPATYGAAFDQFDTSGFDECVPTVAACRYPDGPFLGQPLPDHGEVWSHPWAAETLDHKLVLRAKGSRLPYHFQKAVFLEGDEVVLDYQMRNHGEVALKFLWSSHPLLSVEPESRIMLPPEVERVMVNSSRHQRLGRFGDECPWPAGRNGSQRLDVLQPPSAGFADKLFTPRLHRGYCALYKPRSNESICFRFDERQVPYVGLWICQGGWPDDGRAGHYTVALEPCSGRPDSLAEAVRRGEHDLVGPGETREWSLRVRLAQGEPDIE